MCIGVPMRVKESGDGYAICEGMGETKQISTLLVGDQPEGTWLLTFLDAAREVLTEEDAVQITDAVTAVNLVMQGQTDIDHLFADLIDREPQLPPSATATKTSSDRG
ncbi:MAG: HypC/HybG/HupF family hydrogenase formation chaperone [Pseudomonadota bacterium]